MARFEKYGQRMVFAPDYHFFLPVGPLWIETRLRQRTVTLDNGEKVLEVQAISMRTEIESILNRAHPDSA
jgi:hypothetical protein